MYVHKYELNLWSSMINIVKYIVSVWQKRFGVEVADAGERLVLECILYAEHRDSGEICKICSLTKFCWNIEKIGQDYYFSK